MSSIFAFLGFALTLILTYRPVESGGIPKMSDPVLIPPSQIERFTFGYNDFISDLLWLRSIQTFDYCGSTFKSNETIKIGSATTNICEKGWVFQMLDAATRVTPRYRVIYSRGAINLSVVVNDKEGASAIFDRGTEVLKYDWVIHYMSGYHELFEMKNVNKAAKSMEWAAQHGAPKWVAILSAKLFSDAGQAELGFRALSSIYSEKPFTDWPARAQERWHELEEKVGRKVIPFTQ